MMRGPCDREPEVARALRRGPLPDELASHAATCPACAAAARVGAELRDGAARTRPQHPLPTADALWWRAQVLQRLLDREAVVAHATRPARCGWMAGLLVAGVALLLGLGGEAPRLLGSLLASLGPSYTLLALAAATAAVPLALMGALGFLLREG